MTLAVWLAVKNDVENSQMHVAHNTGGSQVLIMSLRR